MYVGAFTEHFTKLNPSCHIALSNFQMVSSKLRTTNRTAEMSSPLLSGMTLECAGKSVQLLTVIKQAWTADLQDISTCTKPRSTRSDKGCLAPTVIRRRILYGPTFSLVVGFSLMGTSCKIVGSSLLEATTQGVLAAQTKRNRTPQTFGISTAK